MNFIHWLKLWTECPKVVHVSLRLIVIFETSNQERNYDSYFILLITANFYCNVCSFGTLKSSRFRQVLVFGDQRGQNLVTSNFCGCHFYSVHSLKSLEHKSQKSYRLRSFINFSSVFVFRIGKKKEFISPNFKHNLL